MIVSYQTTMLLPILIVILVASSANGQLHLLHDAKDGMATTRPNVTLGEMEERLQRLGLSKQCKKDWEAFTSHANDPLLLMGRNKDNLWAAKSTYVFFKKSQFRIIIL